MAKTYEMDMTQGSLLKKMLIFALPVMASGMLQLLFNAVDVIVVGRLVGTTALAAVGACAAAVNLFIGLFMGLSIGANVMVSRYYGAGRFREMNETLHTALVLAVILGAFVGAVAFCLARPLLELLKTPDDVIGQAVVYFRIYVLGAPVILLYNFGAACLRAVGDTRRPLFFLCIGGAANVLFNLFFVLAVGIGVAGVAIGTVISNLLSSYLVVRCLYYNNGSLRFDPKELKISKSKLAGILKIGLPSGLQGTVFTLSNMVVQSSVNSFGSVVMAGNTAAQNIEGFVYQAMRSMHDANLSFTAQNMGAGKYDRAWKIMGHAVLIVTVIGVVLGGTAYLASPTLLRIYTGSPEVIAIGRTRMMYICLPYFICGLMDTLVGSLRGIGYSIEPMVISLSGSCAFRLLWIFTFFAGHHSLSALYVVYPISWIITAAANLIAFAILFRRFRKRVGAQE